MCPLIIMRYDITPYYTYWYHMQNYLSGRLKLSATWSLVQQPVQFKIKTKIEALYYWPFLTGIKRWPVNSPNKAPVIRKACHGVIICFDIYIYVYMYITYVLHTFETTTESYRLHCVVCIMYFRNTTCNRHKTRWGRWFCIYWGNTAIHSKLSVCYGIGYIVSMA